jgi:EAL domain-containing protein (putative c-di-GMP-specific phosphodiesterase class I)
MAIMEAPTGVEELRRLLDGGLVHSHYQPIVELRSGLTVGHEALARGPQDSPLHSPGPLFAAAAQAGRTAELDAACRRAAFRGALDAGLDRTGAALFVNVEPAALDASGPDDATGGLEVVVEVTERDLTTQPAELLAYLDACRERGWRVALDDVGADARSLALMPVIRPDVIKLDMRFVQEPLDRRMARTLNAVAAQAERSGALLLAEGIETEDHLDAAMSFGAQLGQGWLFGRPAPLGEGTGFAAWGGLGLAAVPPAHTDVTPFGLLSAARPTHRATKRRLLEMSLQLEAEAQGDDAALVLATFQQARHFTPITRRRYERLAGSAAFIAALAVGLGEQPATGVRGVDLAVAEPLTGEWDVIVVGPHFAGAFSARDLGDAGPDDRRRFDYALSYDRELVCAAAEALLRRTAPALA